MILIIGLSWDDVESIWQLTCRERLSVGMNYFF